MTAEPLDRLLVIGSGASEEYRGYAMRALAERYSITLLDPHAATWQLPLVEAAFTPADLGARSFVDAAATLVARGRFDGVLTWDERLLSVTAEIAEQHGLPHASPEAIANCRDKWRTRELLREYGVPSARSVKVEHVEDAERAAVDIGFPVVLKPRALAGSIGVVLVRDLAELRRRWSETSKATLDGVADSKEVLVEEYLDGDEISVESVSFRGVMHTVALTDKSVGLQPFFEELGHVVAADRTEDPEFADVQDVVERALSAVGFTNGVSHVELKLTARGPRVIEINGRLGGDLIPRLVQLATGVDLVAAAAAVAVGRAPALAPTRKRSAAIRFFYPDHSGIVTTVSVPNLEQRSHAVEQIALMVEPGEHVALPPTAFLSRLGFVTVTGLTAADCNRELDDATASMRIDVTPE
ncbi:ATP-grasp domain-containing protein [Curtobacterium poinsettiae]|uniref:ATP-grasp domain-containing protein n=1 Tax=Curtobacterium poinsettiae TaxID=159612 RepID=UPI00217DE329|nr:ATP-grasp domain-containing protein [Curtobacterium flaccumfaciens]MCS6577410.1 ATP-grasp domain-containing protein [Curtobacterium flaccumfaciens]